MPAGSEDEHRERDCGQRERRQEPAPGQQHGLGEDEDDREREGQGQGPASRAWERSSLPGSAAVGLDLRKHCAHGLGVLAVKRMVARGPVVAAIVDELRLDL